MEKNLPFVSLSFTDNAYNKFIIPFLGKLDDGNVFKNIITFLFSILALGILIGGIYLTIDGLLGENGFIKNYITKENITGGKIAGSIVGLISGFLISLITAWALYSVLKKRTEQLKGLEYVGLLDFVFNRTFPKLILIIGELLFILFLYGGILQIIASLVGSYAYAPLSSYPNLILSILPGMDSFNQLMPNQIYGDYDNFGGFIKIGIIAIATSFIVLIAFYIYKEVYSYILKLATNLIGFLPKFAIPLAIRKRNEN
jgi:hypothetical protein